MCSVGAPTRANCLRSFFDPSFRQYVVTVTRDRVAMQGALDRMNISEMFNARVTAEDDCETLAQQLLSASLKLQRPPNCCVVFESSPRGIAAAHNASMKVTSDCQLLHLLLHLSTEASSVETTSVHVSGISLLVAASWQHSSCCPVVSELCLGHLHTTQPHPHTCSRADLRRQIRRTCHLESAR